MHIFSGLLSTNFIYYTQYKHYATCTQFISYTKPSVLVNLLAAKLHYTVPEAISLAEGMPNEVTFPFEEIQILLKDGQRLELRDGELSAALQYIPTQGYPPLVNTLKEFTLKIHQPPCWENCELLVTNGSQDGLSKSIEMCIQEGDPVLMPNPLYAGIESIVRILNNQYLIFFVC